MNLLKLSLLLVAAVSAQDACPDDCVPRRFGSCLFAKNSRTTSDDFDDAQCCCSEGRSTLPPTTERNAQAAVQREDSVLACLLVVV